MFSVKMNSAILRFATAVQLILVLQLTLALRHPASTSSFAQELHTYPALLPNPSQALYPLPAPLPNPSQVLHSLPAPIFLPSPQSFAVPMNVEDEGASTSDERFKRQLGRRRWWGGRRRGRGRGRRGRGRGRRRGGFGRRGGLGIIGRIGFYG